VISSVLRLASTDTICDLSVGWTVLAFVAALSPLSLAAQICIDPEKIFSCYKGKGSDECDDGREHQTADGEAQDGARGRGHPGQHDCVGGLSGL
jgi:hypothetical protein